MPRPLPLSAALLAASALMLAPTAATADVPVAPITPKIIGMSAPSNLWNQRLSEVGPQGVKARRIFSNLASNGRSSSSLIEQAVNAGMTPVVSYKVSSVATLKAGGYDSWIAATRTYLNSLGVQVTATFHHEPYGDMSGSDFLAGSTKFLALKSPTIAVGPILNGWLLDNKVSTFASYTSPTLLAAWDFVGVDSYQSGSMQSPGSALPARAVPLVETWLDGQGFGDKPIVVGEFNGFTSAALNQAGEWLLSTPEVWIAMVFNSDAGGRGVPLTGDRLAAYKATKSDPRAQQ